MTWNGFPDRRWLGGAIACFAAIGLWTASAVEAGPIVLDATDAGFVTSMGGSAKGDGTVAPPATYNYSVGWEEHYTDGSLSPPPYTAMERKNYFVFDLTGITSPITSAALVVNAGTYESSDPSETLDLYAPAPGPALADADFLLSENAVGTTAFDDPFDPAVGTAMALYGVVTGGPAIGTAIVSAADDDMDLIIPIDVGFLNAFLGSRIIFGGELSTLATAGTPEEIMGFTGPDIPGGSPLTPELHLTVVPVPSAVWMALAMLSGLGAIRLRRRRRAT